MESLLALAGFAFVTAATPGPNNLLLTSSGIRFGLKRTIPHILGIQFGIALQLILCSAGVGMTLMNIPAFSDSIRVLGTVYLGYLAWRVCQSTLSPDDEDHNARPFTFLQAASFQFINPKAWIMSLTAGALFLPPWQSQWLAVLALCATMFLVGGPSSGSWAIIGSAIRHYLTDRFWKRVFNGVIVGLTAYAALTLWTV